MSLIVPGNLPGVGLDVDAVVAQAEVLKGLGSAVSNGGAATLRAWQKLPASYQSDGSEHLYDVMTPVGAAATSVGDGFLAVAAALSAYAETVRPIQAALKTLRADATAFAASAKNFKPHDEATTDIWVKLSNPVDFIDAPKTQITSWDQDPTMVDKNNALIRKSAALEQQWLEAQQTCSNAILAAGGSGVHAIAGQKTPAQIMAQAEKMMVTQDGTTSTPWGATSSRKESCGEKALGFPAHLVGGVLTGALGILKGVSSLVLGWDGTGTPWEVQLVQGLVSGDGAKESAAWGQAGQTYSGSWLGLSHLANSLNPVNDVMDGIALSPLANVMPASMRKYMQDNAHADGTALAGAVGGLVGLKVPDQWWTAKAWDGFNPAQSWVDDPGGTLGSSALNVGSLFVGGGGAASGVGHAAEGAADASEAVDAASGAGHAADAGAALADVSKATEGDLAAAGVKGLDGADVSHSVDGLKVDVGDNGLSDSLGKLKTFNEHDVPATHDLDRTPAEVTHSWDGQPARSEDAIRASQGDTAHAPAAAEHAPAAAAAHAPAAAGHAPASAEHSAPQQAGDSVHSDEAGSSGGHDGTTTSPAHDTDSGGGPGSGGDNTRPDESWIPDVKHGVRFFGMDQLKYFEKPNALLGRPGDALFMMPESDAGAVTDPLSAAIHSGMAPSALEAFKSGHDVYGAVIPVDGLAPRLPTFADANGWQHFLPGGHTAVNVGGEWMVNTTREFVVDGGVPMPRGTMVFKLLKGGAWEPIMLFG
ncbi:MAG: hypothetical protein JWP75_1651 [Frondihabitans sp.]|nr:hypothetical protein [Frondihabitans sp.]